MIPPEARAALAAQDRQVPTYLQQRTRPPVDSDSNDVMPELVEADEEYLIQRRIEALAGNSRLTQGTRYLPPFSNPPPVRDERYIGGGNQILARTTSTATTVWNQAEYVHAHPMLWRHSPPPPIEIERITTSSAATQTTSTASNTLSNPLTATATDDSNSISITNAAAQARLQPSIYDPSSRRPTGDLPLISTDPPIRRQTSNLPAQAPQPPSRLPPHRHPFDGNYRTPRRRARSPRATAATTARYRQVMGRRLEERARAETDQLDPETRSEALQHPLNPIGLTPLHSAPQRRMEDVADAVEAHLGRTVSEELRRGATPGEFRPSDILDELATESMQPHSEHIEDLAAEYEALPPVSQQIRDVRDQRSNINPYSDRVIDYRRGWYPPPPGAAPGTEYDHYDHFTIPTPDAPPPNSLQSTNPLQPGRPSWAARRRAEQAEERQRERDRGLHPDTDRFRIDYRPALFPPPPGLRTEDYEDFVASMPDGEGPSLREWAEMVRLSATTTARGSWAARRRAQQRAERESERNRGLDEAPVPTPVPVSTAAPARRSPWAPLASASAAAFMAGSSTVTEDNNNDDDEDDEEASEEETAAHQTEMGIRRRNRVRDALVEGRVMGEEEYRREVDNAMMRDQEWEDMSRIVERRGLGVTGPMGE
jgi:hypothetical protein